MELIKLIKKILKRYSFLINILEFDSRNFTKYLSSGIISPLRISFVAGKAVM